jgi:YVTN family beta-propeller protein
VTRGSAGGTGGSAYTKTCARDSAVSGFRGRGFQYLDQLDIECKALNTSGRTTGSGTFLGAVGGTGGSAQGPYGCGTGNPAFSIHGTALTTFVDGFAIQCRQGVLNAAPTITNPGNQSGRVGTAVNLAISASDPNGDALSYSATGLPAGLSINTGTGNITGTPTTPNTYNVSVTVSDGSATANAPFTWTIIPANVAPVLVNPGNQLTVVGAPVDLAISASDANPGDTLTYSASGLPAGLGINANTGHVTGTPTVANVWNVTVSVSDGSLGDSEAFTLDDDSAELGARSRNPGGQSGVTGTPTSLALAALDPNGDGLTYDAGGLPPGLGIDHGTGLITGTPTEAGIYGVVASVSDNSLGDSESFTWTIVDPNVAPVVNNPGDQTGTVGVPVDLAIGASDANPGDTLTFSASGLPPGLAIDPSTGHVTGTPTISGLNDNVLVTASDGSESGSAGFRWTIFSAEAFVLDPLPSTTPRLANTEITFTASARNGVNTRYKWYFDDGTPETPYSSSPSITHTFSGGGVYFVTVTAVDERNLELIQGVVQAIYLPATTNRPAVSSNIAYTQVGSTKRLYIVNQDNSSVTVFNAASNARLKQLTVGAAPRSLAVAPNGEIWVTSKEKATISVIDPATNNVTRTINLPQRVAALRHRVLADGRSRLRRARGLEEAAPAAPGDGGADGESRRRRSSASDLDQSHRRDRVRLALRHAAAAGEETGLVQLDSDHGGLVLAVDAASMSVRKSIVLQNSDLPDFENQGSGVPNYLGPAVISPDGTQAWVPSKQDNIRRGMLRNGLDLNFQNTVRAISSRIDLASESEDYAARVDLDNAGVASAAAYDKYGIYLFVALETSQEVAVVDAFGHFEIFRFRVGRARRVSRSPRTGCGSTSATSWTARSAYSTSDR